MRAVLKRLDDAVPAERKAALLARPKLASDVVIHEPAEPGASWIVQRGSQHYLRVGADLATLLRTLDGVRDHSALVDTLGPPWSHHEVGRVVESLWDKDLLDDGRTRRHSGTWFKFVAPLTFQFTVLRPEGLLRRLAPVIRMANHRAARVLALALAVSGLLALVVQAPALHQALGRPLPMSVLLGIACASLVTTALHELGHGAVLAFYGGRPSRMGVMLFYLTPAFFCDVSDGWRLPRKEQRVWVSLAGIVTQVVIAGAAAVTALLVAAAGSSSALRDGLLVFALSTTVTALLNFMPFVKLDGYIALMSHLDIPHLRDLSMTDARRFVARMLFGGRYRRELPQVSWAVGFGLACMLFPLYLVAVAAGLWLPMVQGTGVTGAAVVLAGAAYVLYLMSTGTGRLVKEARAGGARLRRISGVGLLAALAVGAVLTFVRVPYTVDGGYVRDLDGTRLVLSEVADLDAIEDGAEVTLRRGGLVTRTDTGSAVIGDGRARRTTAPLSAFVPVAEGAHIPVPALGIPLTVDSQPEESTGNARVDAGQRALGAWIYLKYIAPAWR